MPTAEGPQQRPNLCSACWRGQREYNTRRPSQQAEHRLVRLSRPSTVSRRIRPVRSLGSTPGRRRMYVWQPRYNSRASSFSRCDSHERCFLCARVCVCVILGAYSSSRNQEQSVSRREVQFQLLFFCFFFFCCNISCLLLCTCVGIFTGTRCL